MTLVKHGQLIDQENVSRPTKSGIRVISEMSTTRILWFVANKHRVGLLAITAIVSLGFNFNVDNVIATLIF